MSNLYFTWEFVTIAIDPVNAGRLLEYVNSFAEAFAPDSGVKSMNLSSSYLVSIGRTYPDEDFPYYYDNEEFQPCSDPSITNSWGGGDSLDENRAVVSRDGVQWLYTNDAGHYLGDTDLTPIFPVSWLEAIASNRPLPTAKDCAV